MAGKWTNASLPDLSGKTIVITGANSGIGFEAAMALAAAKACVVLACRRADSAAAAADSIRAKVAGASIETIALDLANLASVRSFADEFKSKHPRLDVLINNAGVMAIPYRTTADGFEMQFGTNHLGHFALTGLLLDQILAAPAPRVVNVSSGMHRIGRIRFDDLEWKRGYRKWFAYGMSKLANLLFTLELSRRAARKNLNLVAAACHPGYAGTNLQAAGARMTGSKFMESMMALQNRLFSQSAAMGALPTTYAAASVEIHSGDYIGPNGIGEMRGYPAKAGMSAAARDEAVAARLWEVSEKLTGVKFTTLDG